LPYPAKKLERVAIIGEELPPALQNKEGIELIGTEEIVRRISKGKKNSWGFQKLLVHSSWQEKIKPLAKILGPKKMFPNSKDGTLTDDLVKAVEEIHKGKMELRSDKDGNLHTLLGKVDFNLEQLEKNYQVLLKAVMGLKASN
jgi:large subunit ribosomal protein L1